MTRTLTILGYLAAASSVAAFFVCTAAVRKQEDALAKVHSEALVLERAAHMLEVEWAYLSSPPRLARYAAVYLPHLQPLHYAQFTPSMAALPQQQAALENPSPFQVSALPGSLVGALNIAR